ncbi:MAG: TonB family protein [Bacteroidetes bacterium]|nr:TonB family protein [Bacteroidota bacterium]
MKKLFFLICLTCAIQVQAQTTQPENDVLTIAEKMPAFPGGDQAMTQFVQKNLQYPAVEREYGISGTVYVTFVVEKDGSLSGIRCLRGVNAGPGLNKEALRIISSMPNWIPGSQNGRLVRIQYNFPIKFRLEVKPLNEKDMKETADKHYKKGLALAKQEKYKEAIAEFDYTVFYLPADVDVLYQRGLAFHNLKNNKAACDEWNKIKFAGSNAADKMLDKYCK